MSSFNVFMTNSSGLVLFLMSAADMISLNISAPGASFLIILHIIPVSGGLKDTRNDATAYSFYKFNLELLGFSSEEPDLIGIAEKKATELSKEITDKAVEKVKETTTQAAEQAKDAAVKAATDAKDSLVKKVDAKADSVATEDIIC